MNGDINGTMEEPMELALPTSPNNEPCQQTVISENCDDITDNCENSNNSEPTDHVDGESSNHSTDNGITACLLNNNSCESNSKLPHEGLTGVSKQVLSEDYTNNSTQNLCENSNDSGPTFDCLDTSQTSEQKKQDNEPKVKTCNTEDEEEQVIDDIESDDDSSIENVSISGENQAGDTVSIHSDSEAEDGDETSQESQSQNRSSDIIILDSENQPISQNGDSKSPEVHEIESDNDDCVVACDEKPTAKEKLPLRRSSRAIKRRKYTDDVHNGSGSDIEPIEILDTPVCKGKPTEILDTSRRKGNPIEILDTPISKGKPIVINDTKALLDMAAKQMRGNNYKKETTIVNIDTPPKNMATSVKNSTTTSNSVSTAQNLYQSIVARGTTVTPVSAKTTTATQVSQNTQPPILPSLTDDMFVVEAPSFIVPYVYEKPSIKPFREFVFKLGKELEEQKEKEKKEEETVKTQDTSNEKKDGEQDNSENESNSQSTQKLDEAEVSKKKKSDKKEHRRRRDDDDDASWDGTSASDSDGALSDEQDKIVVKDKTEPIDQIKNVTELTADKICSSKAVPSSMDCTLGKFFINIGLNLVQEFVQTDLLKQQNRKLYKEKKSGQSTKGTESSIAQLKKNLEFSKENNAPYVQTQTKCEFCSFKTESMLVMANHLETPHMKNNMYKCNFCSFEVRSPHVILYHMEAEHNIRGKLERAPSYHQCANCPFEDNGKGKMARHLLTCAKKFKPETNLSPPVDWEPPAKIPKIAKPRNNIMGPYQNTFNRGQIGNNTIRTPITIAGMAMAAGASGVGGGGGFRARGRSLLAPPRGVPILRGAGMMPRNTPPIPVQNNFTANTAKPKPAHQPSISITPLPRLPPPPQVQQTKNTFVICEICDGYIKDLEQLRNHMQWIHKVKIHPKMIYNRPPLNCQKCQFRFFTDQGLERHLLGSHGLVTSSMQEAANKGKDAGRCPVCGRVYQWKLLNHVARDHNLTLKPAHLSYKCTVCTATFGMYKQFENHVYSAHSVVAKRAMDKSKSSTPPAKGNGDARNKQLKINDEITIIPQPAKSTTSTNAKEK